MLCARRRSKRRLHSSPETSSSGVIHTQFVGAESGGDGSLAFIEAEGGRAGGVENPVAAAPRAPAPRAFRNVRRSGMGKDVRSNGRTRPHGDRRTGRGHGRKRNV
ncbi:hypothetical protein GGP83_001362 [Salinibacter ruber]|uniref:Uncharacterized protein n=1 Tax=Salinibacter ruber TaxID=146919 RepID=A0A9X2U829_9BACT|nr:hypothetical protein [Salinibacter ruber]